MDRPGIDEGCDPPAVLLAHGCLACHGQAAQGGLDLRADGLAGRVRDAPSNLVGCEGRRIVDVSHPEDSQLLRLLTAAPTDRCNTAMPPGGARVSDTDVACLTAWVHDLAGVPSPKREFVPASVASGVTRAKQLTVGQAPTAEELARVEADPVSLGVLIDAWTREPAFEETTRANLRVLLQTSQAESAWLQIDGASGAGVPGLLGDALEESVLATAWDLVARDAPLSELFHTRRWAVSTAQLVLMAYADQTREARDALHGVHRLVHEDDPLAPHELEDMILTRRWSVPLPDGCRDDLALEARELLHLQWGFVRCEGMANLRRLPGAPLDRDADYSDHRFVTFVPASHDPEPFWDVAAWRAAEGTVAFRQPRDGLVATPAFLNRWETNPDNDARVTTNQAAIVALGTTFSVAEPTPAGSSAGIDEAHAAVGTDCHGCHRQLDPMRGYLTSVFDDTWAPTPDAAFEPAFALGGVAFEGGDLARWGRALAEHPYVPEAWAQKLCVLANGQPCAIDDPVFRRVVQTFTDSGGRYRALVVALYASPLITGWSETRTFPEGPPVRVRRQEEACARLETREPGLCARNRVDEALSAVAGAGSTRGVVHPEVPVRPDAFAVAGHEALCRTLADLEVGESESTYSVTDPDEALPAMVREVAGLGPGHPRHDALLGAVTQHMDHVMTLTGDADLAMRSAYVLACTSPDALSVGL